MAGEHPGDLYVKIHSAMDIGLDRDGITAAARVIVSYVRVMRILELDGEDFGLEHFSLMLKLEQLQHSRVVAASGDNHRVRVGAVVSGVNTMAVDFRRGLGPSGLLHLAQHPVERWH